MSTSAIRVLAVAAVAAAGITCTDSATGLRTGMTAIALAPSFAQAPDGGPDIDIAVIAGTLRSGTDSLTVTAPVEGDSAILEFANVPVTGDSTRYTLRVSALDAANNVVFASEDTVQVKPGTNEPVVPVLEYVAADANATSIDITDAAVTLDWAGALAGDVTCLNRAPKTNPVVTRQLAVTGQSAGGQAVAGVRVGWTSRDTTVAIVDENGLVRSRCSNKSTWVVARTFLDKADSVPVTVTAPPFSLLMSPDSTNVARGATVQLGAVLVDENGNTAAASAVNWTSSNTARATVSSTGLVTGVTSGRVLITARSGDRTTVGVIHVVRPAAAKVATIPEVDTLAVGNTVTYYAKAYDANNRIIGDATGFEWASSNPAVASVTTSGVVKAIAVGNASLIVAIDGRKDTVALRVEATRPGGSIKSRILDAASDQPLAGVEIKAQAGHSVLTDANGAFQINDIQPGDSLFISKFGYVSVTLHDAPVFRNYVLEIPDAGLPTAGGSGNLAGKVVNALSGSGISGVTVKAYKGLNAAPSPKRPNPEVVATTTTNSTGNYSFTLGSGVYTLHFTATGYSENITFGSVVSGQTETLTNVLLPPASAGAGLVVVLTWAPSGTNVPPDLDAHATGPDGTTTGRFHVYTANTAFVSGPDSIAVLELDDTSFGGPEVITIRATAAPGTYRFYVHNYSGRAGTTSKALSDSADARVDVYQDNRVIGTFFPPANTAGTLWKVFEFDGARLFPVNQIGNPADTSGATLPMIIGDSIEADVARISSAIQAIRKGR